MTEAPITWLQHGKVRLALHRLRTVSGSGRTLLILHGLGEQAPTAIPPWCQHWTGSIAALDFTGHGQSTVPRSGGYIAEMLMGDADHAVSELGQVTVIGRGLGAYIALLVAGGRADSVYGTVLCDGPGLAGGAVAPTSASYSDLPARSAPPDPYALLELSRDLRPADYATVYARLALEHSPSETPITVCAVIRPPWLAAVAHEMGVVEASIDEALAAYQADADAARPSAN
jgi:pimeloyl-ACP methyl ester carboxylesterase